MPLFKLFGRMIMFAFSVPMGIVAFLVAMSVWSRHPASGEVLIACTLASIVWSFGIAIQAFIYGWFCALPGQIIEIGLVGVRWHPSLSQCQSTMRAAVSILTVLLLLGTVLYSVSGASPASIGLTDFDNPMKFFGALLLVQAFAVAYPMPRMLGRHVIAATIICCRPKASRLVILLTLRRVLLLISFATVLVALWTLGNESAYVYPRWPIMMLLALALMHSSRLKMISPLVEAMIDRVNKPSQPPSALSRLRNWLSENRKRRNTMKAMQRERSEAVDAAQLDQILERLHDEGPEALSENDRGILRRVSENLRREKQT